MFKHGHPIGPDGANTYGEALFGKKLVYEVEGIEIARPEFGKLPSFKFPLPKKFEIMYPMGFPEYVSAYGKENDAQWLEAYEGFVDHMCDDMYINMMDYVFKKERQSLPQIERYFRGFGGQLTPYYRVNKASLPIEILLKFIKREIF